MGGSESALFRVDFRKNREGLPEVEMRELTALDQSADRAIGEAFPCPRALKEVSQKLDQIYDPT